jgi:hypothetical protein
MWLVLRDSTHRVNWFSVAVLGLAFSIALWQIICAAKVGLDGDRQNYVKDPGRFYLRALKLLWSQEWLLGVLLLVFLLDTADNVVQLMHTRVLRPQLFASSPHLHMTLADYLRNHLSHAVAAYAGTSLNLFFPNIRLTRSFEVSTLSAYVLAALFLVANFRAKKSGQHTSNILLITSLLNITGAVALVGFILRNIELTGQAEAVRAGQYYGQPSSYWIGIIFLICRLVAAAVIPSVLMGGLLGSLKRNENGESCTVITFAQDACRFVGPLAGIYFAAYILSYQGFRSIVNSIFSPFLKARELAGGPFTAVTHTVGPIIQVLLMFAPYLVVLCATRAWPSIKAGWRLWLSNAKTVLPFVAFGVTLITLLPFVLAPLTIRTLGLRLGSSRAFWELPVSAVWDLLTFVMTLAVWELCRELVVPKPVPADTVKINAPGDQCQ